MSSAKLDNRELQRQIGCMNGIFHLFDRHNSFTARTRRSTSHRRLPPPTPHTQCKGDDDKEELAKQRNHRRTTSNESPRTSFSSSLSSSTFSSMDNNKTVDLRDVVKDSIYKETVSGLSVKTTRGANHTIKYVDSPRPPLPYRQNETETTLRSKYAPRFSYDGRESRDSWTSTMKLKELPRLSLDSRQSTKHVQNEGIHRRSSSVVAKLMGLEGLPDSVSSDINCYRQDENLDTTPRLLRSKYNQESIPASTSLPALSPHLTSREPALRKPASPTSIYGEIEKRLTDLEFKSSGKDLRALKQILEAMEKTRERLEVKNEDKAANLEHQNIKDCTNYGNPDQNSRSEHNSYPASPTSKRNGSSSSSIVIMKSAKFSERRTSASSAAMPINKLKNSDAAAGVRSRKSSNISVDKIQGPRENHLRQQQSHQNGNKTKTKAMHSLKLPPQPLPVSPRLLQQKKHHNNQPNDQSSSPGRKIKLKSSIPKKCDKKGATKTTQQGDTASVQSDSIDSEVQSTGHSEEINCLYPQDIPEKLRKDAATGEFRSTIEQPSPISVLDATFYREGSPSPVRKISNAFTDDETQNSEETEWSTTVELDHLLNNTDTDAQPMFNQEKLESINQLVLKLKELNSTNEETDEASYSPHNSEDQNPDHSYITQIILASGLLFKDLSAYSSTLIQLKPPLLNPSLFLVLEQTKGSIDESNIADKIHRKLIFDVVNEILVQKINDSGFYRSCISVEKLGQKKLVKELCSEVDLLLGKADCNLQDEDDEEKEDYLISMLNEEMMHKSGNWIDYRSELPALALDIERLIFKDLITEVVQGSRDNKHYCKLLKNISQ
ncbi:protein LONGIFOLIA 1-like [Impatiens glandulifera]|uniref:protein LONGIFOLIA 1-like n=1 Tax=Impatiens glandulifera TaxID=253017 RepID=UPI001FB11BEA|nr:protein LONGIFOLIA 1-like [Impatiens glandulifera]